MKHWLINLILITLLTMIHIWRLISDLFCPFYIAVFPGENQKFLTQRRRSNRILGCLCERIDSSLFAQPCIIMVRWAQWRYLSKALINQSRMTYVCFSKLGHHWFFLLKTFVSPFTNMVLTVIQAGIINYTHYKVWDEISYPFPNFNGYSIEVWKWISNFIPHHNIYVIPPPPPNQWHFSHPTSFQKTRLNSLLWNSLAVPTRVFCRGVAGFVMGCACVNWDHELIYSLYIGQLFANLFWIRCSVSSIVHQLVFRHCVNIYRQ